MPVDENGIYVPITVEQAFEYVNSRLIDAGVDPDVTKVSDYIQTTNPQITLISSLSYELSTLPTQVVTLMNAQNVQIERAGIFTSDAILNLLLADEDIMKADVRNFNPCGITIYIFNSDPNVLIGKDYIALTQNIVNATCIGNFYAADANNTTESEIAQRPNSLQTTEVIYNIANLIAIDNTDPLNLLTVTYSTITSSDLSAESMLIDGVLTEYFSTFKIGQQVDTTLVACAIVSAYPNKYASLNVTFSNTTPINAGDIFVYVSSTIVQA